MSKRTKGSQVVSLARHRFGKKVPEYLVDFESWTGMRARFLGYFEQRISDLDHPDPNGSMIGTCPMCGRRSFELDDLWGMWQCSGCKRAGNHWTLEALLHPGEDWGACAARADRMMANAWDEGDPDER
jgi:hypothetical protein